MSEEETSGDSQPGMIVVELPDEMDYHNSQELHDQLAAAVQPGITTVIADMTATVFCDSAGLASIIRASRIAAEQHAELRVAASARLIRKLFQMTGLDAVVAIYPTVDAAFAGGEPPDEAGLTWEPRR